jgi:hypothetical protein
MNQKNPIRQTRDTRHDAIAFSIRQQKTNPNTTHTNSAPHTQNPVTVPATTTTVFKINPMLNGRLVDSCFL